ncbi:hypothetical protein DEU56DRAFT_871127 [Suillus clintonianus]|uniref:uncharacterized protein n=1 Tax=Suillus clintonianus TaxID=1904413 RepID=UPI001B85D793|nr:uncharacterized protein DEU56DRAFT_871127 [Suillus clintonianus]KAG2139254.1 hypothetical protein DEU56DRAFT_871127 [Suillus clintonianus]
MALMVNDPNTAILPNFRTAEHKAARNQLIANGVADDAQAAELLAMLWTINNNADRECWAEQIEEAARDAEEAQRLAAEEEQEHHQALEEEQEAARKEEQKKNKSKFVPIGNSKVPSVLVVIPSHYAVRKLKAGEYCELYYFTNKGLKDAKKTLLSTEAPRLMLTTNAEGQQTWVNADETRDPKAVVTKDENLSWEHFNEAAPRMITAMKQHGWPEDRHFKITAGDTPSTL